MSRSLYLPLCLMNLVNSVLWSCYGFVSGARRAAAAGRLLACCCRPPLVLRAERSAQRARLAARCLRPAYCAAHAARSPPRPRPPQAIRDWFIAGPNAYGSLTSLMAVAFCLLFPRDPAELVKTESRFFRSESRSWLFARRGSSTVSSSAPGAQLNGAQANGAAAAAGVFGGGGGIGGGEGASSAPADQA
jgi:hypothetical protein